jgi:hypothetical protein
MVMSKDTECDKHIIKVAEPSPAVTVVNLSTRGLDVRHRHDPVGPTPNYGGVTLR